MQPHHLNPTIGVRPSESPFRFSSEYADDALGLVYYNYRHYEPVTGRWLQRDMIEEEGGVVLYGICLNRIIESVDYWNNCKL